MKIESRLLNLKKEIDKELEIFFKSRIEQVGTGEMSTDLRGIMGDLEKFILNSGKRIRPILFYSGYVISGGKDQKEALRTSIAFEFIHSYFLVHDDIIDRDDFRHGVFSMHCQYKKKAEKIFSSKDPEHFGLSMAIIIGDLASAFGYEIINNSNFEDNLKLKALNSLNKTVTNTIFGQSLDLILNEKNDFDMRKIIRMQKCKTAKYTIEGPLRLGAILAGANQNFLDSLGRYAVPVGIAFQIQDDIIGIFGDKEKIGKPIGSDIKEGKKTLLIAMALAKADRKQRNVLMKVFGNEDINKDDIDNVRDIIIETGSLEFSRRKTRQLLGEAKEGLSGLKISKENRKFLSDLADFVAERRY